MRKEDRWAREDLDECKLLFLLRMRVCVYVCLCVCEQVGLQAVEVRLDTDFTLRLNRMASFVSDFLAKQQSKGMPIQQHLHSTEIHTVGERERKRERV